MSEVYADIFSYVTGQEALYKVPIQLTDSWTWSMPEHIRTATLYKHSQLKNGKSEFTPVKNIVKPILNLQYRAEGFDVKDITLYIDDSKQYYKSFLVKKFHEKWARENGIDSVIDSMVESYVDYGGALLKNVNDVKPEVVPLQSIVFCDQTDILNGPIGIKHFFSPSELMKMSSRGWGDLNRGATATLEETIILSRNTKKEEQNNTQVQTPGKYIEIYEVHGEFPKHFLGGEYSQEYSGQLHILCFYQGKDGTKTGITLFKGEEKKSPFKLIKRDQVYGRALGFGGVEELEEAQVWTNYNMIRKQDMLDAASKTLIGVKGSNTASILNGQKLKDMDNMNMVDLGLDGDMGPIDTFPRNIKLFTEEEQEWEVHAQKMGSAQEAIMGEQPPAGTPLGSVQIQQMENHSLHNYRQGKLATFWDEVEQDWILPHISREISKDQEFVTELELDELQYVVDSVVTCETNDFIKEKILSGELIKPEEVQGYEEIVRSTFKKKGNKFFFKIFKDEMKNVPIVVKTDIKGKQKNLGKAIEGINNIIRTVVQVGGPTTLAEPATWDAINQSIELSGGDPVDFSGLADAFKKIGQQQMAAQQQPAPQQLPQPQPTA